MHAHEWHFCCGSWFVVGLAEGPCSNCATSAAALIAQRKAVEGALAGAVATMQGAVEAASTTGLHRLQQLQARVQVRVMPWACVGVLTLHHARLRRAARVTLSTPGRLWNWSETTYCVA